MESDWGVLICVVGYKKEEKILFSLRGEKFTWWNHRWTPGSGTPIMAKGRSEKWAPNRARVYSENFKGKN